MVVTMTVMMPCDILTVMIGCPPLKVLVALIAIDFVAVILGSQLVLPTGVADGAVLCALGDLEEVLGREVSGSKDVRIHDHVERRLYQRRTRQLHQLLRLLRPTHIRSA